MEEPKLSIVDLELDSPLLEGLPALGRLGLDRLDAEESDSLFYAAVVGPFSL